MVETKNTWLEHAKTPEAVGVSSKVVKDFISKISENAYVTSVFGK